MSKVKIGKLERKGKYEDDKESIIKNRDERLKKLDDFEKGLGKHQKNKYDDSDARKLIRAQKRAEMQELRDKERGAIRKDRESQRVQRIANRENLSIKDAQKIYNARQEAYGNFKKPPMKTNLTTDDLAALISGYKSDTTPDNKSLEKNKNKSNEQLIKEKTADNQSKELVRKTVGGKYVPNYTTFSHGYDDGNDNK